MTGEPFTLLRRGFQNRLLAPVGLALALAASLTMPARGQCNCDGTTTITLSGSIPDFKVTGAGEGPAATIEVKLEPEKEYEFTLTGDPQFGCEGGTVSFCGLEYQVMRPGSPPVPSGWTKGSSFLVSAQNNVLNPSSFRLRISKGESDEADNGQDGPGNPGQPGDQPIPANANPPGLDENGAVVAPGMNITIPLGMIGVGTNYSAPFYSAGVLSWRGPVSANLAKPVTAEHLAIEQVKGRPFSIWGPIIPAVTTYGTDPAYPEEKLLLTGTRIFRVTGYNTVPTSPVAFSSALHTYVREYARETITESTATSFARTPVSWWKIYSSTSGVTVEQSVKGVVSSKTFAAASPEELTEVEGSRTRSVSMTPPAEPGQPYDIETSEQDGQTLVSRNFKTYANTADGYQLVSETEFPVPSAGTGNVTLYKYYPSGSGSSAGKLWWVSHPDGSWSSYSYPAIGSTIEYSPFASETVLNPSHSEINSLPCVPAEGLSSGTARLRVRVSEFGKSTKEYVQTIQGVSTPGKGAWVREFSSQATSPVTNGAGDAIPDGIPLVASGKTVSYSGEIAMDSTHRWLAGRTLFTYEDSGRADYYQYEKTAENYLKTTRTTGIQDANGSPVVGSLNFRVVNNLSEREITIVGPEGLLSRETFYHTGSAFTSARLEEYEYDADGRYHRTIVDDVEIHRIDRPDDVTVVETDASGKVVTTKYHTDGTLLWTETAAGGGVGAIRSSQETVGLTTTSIVNGVVTSITTVDGLGRTVSSKDATGAETTYSYPNGGRDRQNTLPGGIVQYESRHLDGSLMSKSGSGWVAEFHSTEVDETAAGYSETRSSGSSTGHTARRTTQVYGKDGKRLRSLQPSPKDPANFIRQDYEYDWDTLVAVRTSEVDDEGWLETELPDQFLYESLNPFTSDAVIMGGLEISGLELDGDSFLALNTPDRLVKRESSFILEGGVVYRKTLEYRYPDPTGANPLVTETRQSLGFIKVGSDSYQSVTRMIEPSGRTLESTTVVTPDTATTVVTQNDSATTAAADTVTTEVNGYVQTVQRAGIAQAATYAYDSFGRIEQYTDHRNASTFSYHAGNFQLEEVTDHLRNTTSYAYYLPGEKNAGKVKTVTRPGGLVEQTAYNDRGQLTQVSGSGTYSRLYEYDAFGDRITLTTYGTQAAVTRWTYQERTGLLEKKRYNDAGQNLPAYDFLYAYTPDGKIAKRTTGKGVVTDYGYHADTRDLTTIFYSNDANLTPDVTFSNHDGFGRPRQVSEARTGGSGAVGTDTATGTGNYTTTQTLAYPPHSGAISIAYASNHRWLPGVEVEHDPADASGRPTGFDVEVGGADVSTQTYGYDTLSRLASVASPHLSAGLAHLTGQDTVQGVTVTLGGNVIHTRTLAVDLLGRTVGVVNKAGPNANSLTTVASIGHAYDAAGRRGDARREDGTRWDYSYNDRSEVTGAIKRTAGNNLVPGLSFGYGYDGMGNRLTSTIGTGTGVSTRSYTPDALNQYEEITHDGKVNVLTRSDAAVTATATNATHNGVDNEGNLYGVRQTATPGSTGKLVTTNLFRSGTAAGSVQTWVPPAELEPTHDLDGNLTWDGRWNYTWDGENRLVSMTTADVAKDDGGAPNVTVKFAYDWMGRRIGKTTVQSGTTTHLSFAYDHWNLVAEWKRTSLTGSLATAGVLQRTHLWGPDIASSANAGFGGPPKFQAAGGVAGLLASTFHSGSTDHFVPSYDANGNILAWSQGSNTPVQRMDYDPFGNAVMVEKFGTSADVDKLPAFGFSTKYQDKETGLYYYGYRYYDPVTGRWPSRDPIGERGGLNLYGFVENGGVAKWDKLGLDGGISAILTELIAIGSELIEELEEFGGDAGDGMAASSDSGGPNGKDDFVHHYYHGNGSAFDLFERGYGEKLKTSVEPVVIPSLERKLGQISLGLCGSGIQLKIITRASREAVTVEHPNLTKVIFSVGDTTIVSNSEGVLCVDCKSRTWSFEGKRFHSVDDRFTDPLNIDQGTLGLWPGTGDLPGAKPYAITGNWVEEFKKNGSF